MLLEEVDYLHEHVHEHGDAGAGRDGDIQEHVLPDGVVLRVAPRQAHHRRDDRQQLGRLHRSELQGNLHIATIRDCHHLSHLLSNINDVREDYVALDDRLESRLNIDLNQLSS